MLSKRSCNNFNHTIGKVASISLLFLLIASCTIVTNEEKEASESEGLDIYFADGSFDAKAYVDTIWDDQVLPAVKENSYPAMDVFGLISSNMASAIEEYGFRQVEEGNAVNFTVHGQADIIAVNTVSRNGTLDVDLDEDGIPDAIFQVGPVFRGTSIRDSLDFIKFDDFKNQLEFAKLSNELNFKVRDTVLAEIDRESLQGKKVEFVGCFSIELEGLQVSSLTPVVFNLIGTEQ